jgi:uncharacterized glyoxalase superfamily protein PhnB
MAVVPDMIGITVRDMAAALRFYRLLGLEPPAGAESQPHVEVTANGYRIAWDTLELVRSLNPHWVEPVGHRMALAFKCEGPAEVDALYARIVEAGYAGHREPWDAFWGQRYATVVDPDGNLVDLFAPLPAQ